MNVNQALQEHLPLYAFKARWIYQKLNEAEQCDVTAPALLLMFKHTVHFILRQNQLEGWCSVNIQGGLTLWRAVGLHHIKNIPDGDTFYFWRRFESRIIFLRSMACSCNNQLTGRTKLFSHLLLPAHCICCNSLLFIFFEFWALGGTKQFEDMNVIYVVCSEWIIYYIWRCKQTLCHAFI